HTVRAGEHLTGIARHYGVSIAAIVRANRLADPSRIYAGQRLTIPGGSSPGGGSRAGGGSAAPAAARTHTVRAGEHLTGIARHYGVSIAAIVRANRLADASRIYAGQRLTIPGGSSSGGDRSPSSTGSNTRRMSASMAALVAERDDVRRAIVQQANAMGVPPAFALAVAWQESGWQQRVVSHAGAIGVMQLMPDTARWVGESMLRTSVDPRDTRQNIRAGVRLLAHYLQRYDGNWDLTLAAYYQGQTAVDRHGIYGVSRPYIASIKVLARLFAG
ncbi:MAG TPA: LysM peptidoglycan-binding domain-containing protein, partial [Candidatus Limnocylindria bacterium]